METKRQFKSKRNMVFLVEGRVEKHFATPAAALREYQKLSLLREKGLPVPLAEAPDGPVLYLEYIEGLTIPDFLETSHSPEELQMVAQGLAGWLAAFYLAVEHDTTNELRGDVNGRNFIIAGEQVWGVDFETREYGKKEQDLGLLLAYIDFYDFADTDQQKAFAELLRQAFISHVDADPALLEEQRQQAQKCLRNKPGAASIFP